MRTSVYLILCILALAALLLVAFGDRLSWWGNRVTEELYDRGQARLAVGDYEGARAAFQKMLEVAPGDPEAKLGLDHALRQQTLAQGYAEAEAAVDEEDWDRAGKEVAAILAVDPNFPDAQELADFVTRQRRLATLYADGGRLYDLGQWQEALSQFETVRSIDASYRAETVGEFLFVCYLNAGEALLTVDGGGVDEVTEAVRYFGQALAIHPRNRTASDSRRLGGLYLTALEALARGDTENARSELSTLVAESPAYAGGHAARRLYEMIVAAGREALAAGDIPGALDRFNRAQTLPVSDTSAAKQGAALARAATPTLPPTPRSTVTFTPVPTPWASIPSGPVTVRSGPGSAFRIVGELAQGAKVAITARLDNGAWLRVCCTAEGKEGWAPSTSLQVQGPLEQAEIVKLRSTATTPATTIVPPATPPAKRSPTPKPNLCVQGSVLNVSGGQGIAGWTVTIMDASGVEKTWRTEGSGFYQFSDLPEGTTTLTVAVPEGWRSVSPLPAALAAAPAGTCAIVDFWAEQTDSEHAPDPPATPYR